MSRHGWGAASAVNRGEPSNERRRGLTGHPLALLLSLAVVLFLSVASVASVASASSFYWYGEGNSTCWQTGQLGASSDVCSNVGAGYLPTPGGHTGGLEWMNDGAANSADFLSPSGDYCSYYRLGDDLTSQISSNEGSATGFTTPTPYSSYQEGDAHNNVCQADGSHWGREIRDTAPGNNCWETCGMGHYVSLRSQGTNDRPWSGVFGGPALVLSAEDDPQTFTARGTNVGAWGYVCPQLEDTATGDILEYCLQEWRGEHNGPKWEQERVSECASVDGHNKDLVSSYFWPGTQFVTERSGSANTYVWHGAGGHHFEAAITETDLVNGVNRDRTEYVQGERSGEPAPGKGCGRSLSTNPADYALIGLSQGTEGWREVTELAGNSANLQLHTEYTPLPPEATTSAASSVQEEEATLNGSVNPKGTDTHYYFQYGETTSYGSSTAEGDAGSGTSSVTKSNTIGELQPGMTYHYRLVASSVGGTSYGADQTLLTFSAPAVTQDSTGTQYYTFEGPNHTFSAIWRRGSTGVFEGPFRASPAHPMFSAPAVTQDSTGTQYYTFEGPNHTFSAIWRRGSTGVFEGPFQESPANTMYSAPAVTQDSTGTQYYTFEGPNHAFSAMWRRGSTGVFEGPFTLSPANTMYSAPAVTQDSTGTQYYTFEGPNHTFSAIWRRGSTGVFEGPFQESPANTMYSAAAVTLDSAGSQYDTFVGPNNTFSAIWRQGSTGNWEGPFVLSGSGTAY